jgi:hypothetical protein
VVFDLRSSLTPDRYALATTPRYKQLAAPDTAGSPMATVQRQEPVATVQRQELVAAVQRQEAETGSADSAALPADSSPAPADLPAPAASAPVTASGAEAPAAAVPAAGPPAGPSLDELARQLFGPLAARLKAELRLDRERAGLLTDLRQ